MKKNREIFYSLKFFPIQFPYYFALIIKNKKIMREEIKFITMTELDLQSLITKAIKETVKTLSLTQNNSNTEEYLTPKEACKFLKIGMTTLYHLKKEGKIPFIKELSKVFYVKSNLREYRLSLERKTVQFS